jgi:DNA oxidative demethylase
MLFAELAELAPGLFHWPQRLNADAQADLVANLKEIVRATPLFVPAMPGSGKPFSVRMTNCGSVGWVADRAGYRYQPTHPVTGQPWPAIPDALISLWKEIVSPSQLPDACLVNFYAPSARMGLHQDKDEKDLDAPVLSVSLGDSCIFRFGGNTRSAPTRSLRLSSGDVLVMSGASRLCFHGVDRIISGTSKLLDKPGRINLTLRVAQ